MFDELTIINFDINCFFVFFLIGKRRASYVKSLSGKNVLYKEDTLICELKGENRTKCLNAMRARRCRQKKKELKGKQR